MISEFYKNSNSLISNIDVAPTISRLLAVELTEDLSYSGYSIFDKISSDRIVYTLNINEWRTWSRGAVAISKGIDRTYVDYQNSTPSLHVHYSINLNSKEELLLAALSEPIVKSACGKIFSDKLKIKK
jgi:hypothetical protein